MGRNYKLPSFVAVWISLIRVCICLHLIRDRPQNDLVGCVHAESTAETNSFVTCDSDPLAPECSSGSGGNSVLSLQALLAALRGGSGAGPAVPGMELD